MLRADRSFVDTVNLGAARPNPNKSGKRTGIGKRPVPGPVEVRAPGPKRGGLGSGLVGDFIGDGKHHGGDGQAVYAFQREDLDAWQERLGRTLPDGFFGENLTTTDLDVNEALVGEVWQVGDQVQLKVTSPRIPCSTFRGWMGERGWAKMFTAAARPGTYLSVVVPGSIRAGDPVDGPPPAGPRGQREPRLPRHHDRAGPAPAAPRRGRGPRARDRRAGADPSADRPRLTATERSWRPGIG